MGNSKLPMGNPPPKLAPRIPFALPQDTQPHHPPSTIGSLFKKGSSLPSEAPGSPPTVALTRHQGDQLGPLASHLPAAAEAPAAKRNSRCGRPLLLLCDDCHHQHRLTMAPLCCSNTREIKIGHVDDVQELRKCRPAAVPERYIRDVGERPAEAAAAASSVLSSSENIPVIDMSRLVRGGEARLEMERLAAACEEWGFFQVVNHGVELELLRRMEELAMEFFMLPLEEKEKYPMAPGTIQGYGHAFVFSENQKLDWCNMLALGLEPHSIRNPKLWPSNPSRFRYPPPRGHDHLSKHLTIFFDRPCTSAPLLIVEINGGCPFACSETLELYSAEIRELCRRLLVVIAESLGLRPDGLEGMFGGSFVQAVRMNYYPPCPRPDLVLGLSPHSDGSALTVLQQDARSAGLQVRKGGAWVPVIPVPGALVINIGDTIEVLTNGKYKSVEHRAVTHHDRDRLSLVTFYAPGYDVELGPLPELVDDRRPCLYRRYNHGEYNRHYVTRRLQGKKTLDFARIDNEVCV
ncbi:hypothetical protein Taro_003858 [Colocasia esculenta]|uniref:Fe2OG dioxygenase domain-containing protein n=1 Tax=Colocasia esculenta TaxID=4460 RepID=A0A843TQ20_COLES|nr:hypothetical protein [Colocasia esculenta]